MASVWMVHSENGMYSDRVYSVEGVFSSREKAVAYIESHATTAYHHVGNATMGVYSRHVDEWSIDDEYDSTVYGGEDTSGVKVAASQNITPTTTDGRTFMFVLPDGTKVDEYDANTYYVTEYEVDAECRDM